MIIICIDLIAINSEKNLCEAWDKKNPENCRVRKKKRRKREKKGMGEGKKKKKTFNLTKNSTKEFQTNYEDQTTITTAAATTTTATLEVERIRKIHLENPNKSPWIDQIIKAPEENSARTKKNVPTPKNLKPPIFQGISNTVSNHNNREKKTNEIANAEKSQTK